jgi:hypothetical protein
MNKNNYPLILSASLIIMAGLYSVPSLGSYFLAFGETTDPTILVSDKLKNDPVAMKIIAEMEAQKERYKLIQEGKTVTIPLTKEQIEVENSRKISNDLLQEDLKSMKQKYDDFTPKNAYEKFVSKLNETYHGIFRDQFDYMHAKVELAIAARNVILEDGGSYYDAQREYYKYASMPRLEMISYIQELNLKYGFANEDIQSNFDANGKLPRFEDDNDAPCYGCENTRTTIVVDPTTKKSNKVTVVNAKVDPNSEIKFLQNQLSETREKFLKSNDFEEKKSLINSLNETVKKIQNLTYG